ncbi:ATP-binding protein [Mucilaginibacter paludis]|uniref:histidine kinase n=1 Tax=Mucilaginibacter paludis DSM 18603 TaxID=714943 RepID=H1YJ22_9SPHI|nr:ATP-binding protein [Mucilaginibacter paludis]EHQ27717.1 multi-sensor hybrid histidine kinase [Mucilaginibacter paludis DSM 18603]
METDDISLLKKQIDRQQLEITRLNQELALAKNSGLPACNGLGDKRDADSHLAETVFRLSATISNLNEAVLLEDENRKIVLANASFCKMFNLKADPQSLVGLDCRGSAEESKFHFKDEAGFVVRIENLLKDRKTAVGDVLELKDGRILNRDFIPINIAGNYIGHLWKYLDITEQKIAQDAIRRREEKYRRIIENMNLGLLEVDTEECIIFANQSFCDITGFLPNELIGVNAAKLFLGNRDEESMKEKRELRKQGISDAYELKIKTKAGDHKWMLISGAPLYDDQKKLTGSIGIHLDITGQKRLESDLIEAKKIAEESSRAKEIFLANMSHEIRTPINAILGLSRLLTKTTQNSQQRTYTEAIIKSAENLIVIINDILDLTKIEAGQIQIENIEFNLADLIKQLEGVLRYKTEEKGLEFDATTSVHVPPVLMGDPYRINQVLLNLVGNAIKFTEKGGIEVWCKLVDQQKDVNEIQFTVKDTGVGMEPEYLKHIFTNFSQEDASITRKHGGTGLGLSISRQLVELMGGKIHVESTKGLGTVISFTLLLPTGKIESVSQLSDGSVEVKQNYRALINREILLVEDNEFNRLLASTILNTYGAVVTEAWNGKIATQMVQEKNFDLIVMDVQMPVMNGFEASRYIRQTLKSAVPIIALTANAIKGEDIKCYEAGMNEYITKPFEEKYLINLICSVLKNKPANQRGATEIKRAEGELYSLETLKQTAGADSAFVNRMLLMFIKQGNESLAQIDEALNEKDLVRLKALAHKIKPSVNYLKMHGLSQWILKVQNWEGGANDELTRIVKILQDKLREVINVIEADLAKQ